MTISSEDRASVDDTNVLKVERPYYEQAKFNSELNYCEPEESSRQMICQRLSGIKPTHVFLSIFPIFSWLSQYSVKSDFIHDVISGFTVAVMHIPQGNYSKNSIFLVKFISKVQLRFIGSLGMGYAMLANIPPIVGIYTAFFPVLIYFIFGTSKHNSMGKSIVLATFLFQMKKIIIFA